jgi:hypothetical protein
MVSDLENVNTKILIEDYSKLWSSIVKNYGVPKDTLNMLCEMERELAGREEHP